VSASIGVFEGGGATPPCITAYGKDTTSAMAALKTKPPEMAQGIIRAPPLYKLEDHVSQGRLMDSQALRQF
jgi:hypothetical protein